MELRKAIPADLPAIERLYNEARAAMKAAGIDQWQDGYPNRETARADLEAGTGYVLEDGGEVVATACLAFGHEPTYDQIYEGAWSGEEGPYGFLHRVAVSPAAKGKGCAGLFFQELKRQAAQRGVRLIRGDTHQDNQPMRRVMEKAGLAYRGVILVEDGTRRLAFEAVL